MAFSNRSWITEKNAVQLVALLVTNAVVHPGNGGPGYIDTGPSDRSHFDIFLDS